MHFFINREAFLKPLQSIAGIIERRQTKPILSNVLLNINEKILSLTGTDTEVELVITLMPTIVEKTGAVTISARKLMEICKSFPEGSEISLSQQDQVVILCSGRSRFTLVTLPVSDYPNVSEQEAVLTFSVGQAELRGMIERTSFAMAQQDVRYYFNGVLLEVIGQKLRAVATDGHRMALCTLSNVDISCSDKHQIIVPRKGILALARLIHPSNGEHIDLILSEGYLRAKTEGFTFTSKLVSGLFPNYEKAIPRGNDKKIVVNREMFRQALNRAAILTTDTYRGVRLVIEKTSNILKMFANNPEREQVEEEVNLEEFVGDEISIGFNVNYLINVLSVFSSENVTIILSNAQSGAIIKEEKNDYDALYVIMPMHF